MPWRGKGLLPLLETEQRIVDSAVYSVSPLCSFCVRLCVPKSKASAPALQARCTGLPVLSYLHFSVTLKTNVASPVYTLTNKRCAGYRAVHLTETCGALEAHQAVECSGRQLVQLLPKFQHFHLYRVSCSVKPVLWVRVCSITNSPCPRLLTAFVKKSRNIIIIKQLGRHNHKSILVNNTKMDFITSKI